MDLCGCSLCAFGIPGAVSVQINLKSDMVLHMTGCCCTCLCVGVGVCALQSWQWALSCFCCVSSDLAATLFRKSSLVIGGEAGTAVRFRGPDRDFNPDPAVDRMRKSWEDKKNERLPITDATAQGPAVVIKTSHSPTGCDLTRGQVFR